MSKNFFKNNKIIGSIIFLLYVLHLKFDIKILNLLFPNKLVFADSWWYWPIKYVYDTSKYIYDNSKYIYELPKYIYESPTYLYDFLISLIYPPVPKPSGFVIPYVKLNDPIIPPTEYEIAQEFFNRLEGGTWVQFLLFIFYISFNYALFWGVYSFFKANFFKLLSLNFFDVFQEKVKEVYIINIIIWLILQIYFYDINIWETHFMEWYYAFTIITFFLLFDLVQGTIGYYSSYGPYYKIENPQEAFCFFKGHHIEFFSMVWAAHLGFSLWLDYMGLLPYTPSK